MNSFLSSMRGKKGKAWKERHLPRREPAAHPIRLRMPWRQRTRAHRLPRRSRSVAAGPTWKRGMVQCQTCQQAFTGAIRNGLAEAWRPRVAGQAAESAERLASEKIWRCPFFSKASARRQSRCCARCLRCDSAFSVQSIQIRWGLRAIWLPPSRAKADMPRLSGSSASSSK